MTHEYTILVGGTIISADGRAHGSAIAWAGGIVLALGDEADVRKISRGDSNFVDLGGALVIPLGGGDPIWPTDASLEVGGPADLVVVEGQIGPYSADDMQQARVIAMVRAGRVVAGSLPGTAPSRDDRDGAAGGADPTIQ